MKGNGGNNSGNGSNSGVMHTHRGGIDGEARKLTVKVKRKREKY